MCTRICVKRYYRLQLLYEAQWHIIIHQICAFDIKDGLEMFDVSLYKGIFPLYSTHALKFYLHGQRHF